MNWLLSLSYSQTSHFVRYLFACFQYNSLVFWVKRWWCWSRATETLNINSFRYYIQECHQGAAPLAACSVACLRCLRFIGATRVSPTSKNVFLVSWPNKGEAKTSNLWVIFETNGLKTNFVVVCLIWGSGTTYRNAIREQRSQLSTL